MGEKITTFAKPGDTITPTPQWNNGMGIGSHALPPRVQVLDVIHTVCQSGVMYRVYTIGGFMIELDAAWFVPPTRKD